MSVLVGDRHPEAIEMLEDKIYDLNERNSGLGFGGSGRIEKPINKTFED